MTNPLITIIVLIYRVEPYLIQCLESIIGQSYKNLEIILSVSIDGSDKCEAICDWYANMDNRIMIIKSKPCGIAAARNLALEKVTGDYIAFVDGDDWIEPDMMEKMLNNLLQNQTQISICGAYQEFKDHQEYNSQYRIYCMDTKEAFSMLLSMKEFGLSLWDKMFDVDVIKNIMFPDTREAEDRYWLYQVIGNSKHIVYDSTPRYHFRFRASSCSRNDINARISLDADHKMCRYILQRYPDLYNSCQLFLYYSNYSAIYSDLQYEIFSYSKDKDLLTELKKHAKIVIRNKDTGISSKIHSLLTLFGKHFIISFMRWRIKVYKNKPTNAYD